MARANHACAIGLTYSHFLAASGDPLERLGAGDPEQRQRDLAFLRALEENPESGALLMLFAYKVIGDVLRKNSRWADADPSDRIAIDIKNRKGQIH